MSTYQAIESFWTTHKRFAFFGLSRRKPFPNRAFRLLQQSGYELIPIHPAAPIIEGIRTYPSLDIIESVPHAAAIIAGKDTVLQALETCSAHGIQNVFIQTEGWSKSAEEFCLSHQINAVHACVLLYHQAGFPHNLHRWFHRTFVS